MHLTLDLYLLVLKGLVPAEEIVRLAHDHLLATCPTCREEFEVDAAEREEGEAPVPCLPPADRPARSGGGPPAELPRDPRHAGSSHLEPREALLDRIRRQRDLDRRHLHALLELPPEEWPRAVESSRTRFRNRSFAERLIVESSDRVHTDPEQAYHLAALVPVVLHWIPNADSTRWAQDLHARALAGQAEALGVAGELTAAWRLPGRA